MAYSFLFKGNFWHIMPLCKEEVQVFFQALCEGLALPDLNLEINVCDDRLSLALNKEFLAMPCPTNILSFPSYEAENENEEPLFLGSLVLNVSCVLREAKLYHQDPAYYSLSLFIHGLGHLLGFDHGKTMDTFCQAAMEKGLQVMGTTF